MKNKNVFDDLFSLRLKLLSISQLTIEDLHSWSSHPDFFKYLEFDKFKNLNETNEYLKKIKKRSNGINGNYWVISLLDGTIIGNYGIINIDNKKKMGEFGYGIHPHYWGNKYFKEATELVVDYLFNNMGFNRIWVKTHSQHLSSIKGLTSCGFLQEGVLRDFYLDNKTDTYADAVILGILKKDIITNKVK